MLAKLVTLIGVTGGIVGWWAAIWLVFTGLGLLARRAVRCEGTVVAAFWPGLALASLVLQILHLALPCDVRTFVVLAVLGGAGLVHGLRSGALRAETAWAAHPAALLVAAVAFVCADQALLPPRLYDTGLYYLPSIAWSKAHPVVLGLGNLHGRLAFNSSWFLLVGAQDWGPWTGRAHHLATGLLAVALVAQCARGLAELATASTPSRSFALLLAMPAAFLASSGVADPTPDAAAAVMGLVTVLALVELMTGGAAQPSSGQLLILELLAIGAIVFKSSLLFLALACLFLAAGRAAWRGAMSRGLAGRMALLAVGGLGSWTATGVLLSGYPLYPLPAFGLPVPWRMDARCVALTLRAVTAWARLPGHPEAAEGWSWLAPWARLFLDPTRHDSRRLLVDPLVLGTVAAAALVLVTLRRGPGARPVAVVLLPPVLALLAWFLTAPDPRFATAAAWSFACVAVALLLSTLPARVALGAGLLLSAGLSAHYLGDVKLVSAGPDRGFHFPSAVPEVRPRVTDAGLTVFVPVRGELCGAAPLPCTPYFDRFLRARHGVDPSSGFLTEPPSEPDACHL